MLYADDSDDNSYEECAYALLEVIVAHKLGESDTLPQGGGARDHQKRGECSSDD